MSAGASVRSEMFNAPPPDNDTQRAILARELRRARSFTPLFALCNDAVERDRQIAMLRETNPDLCIQDIPVRQEIPHLLDVLQGNLADPAPNVVCVYGMENWIRKDAPARSVPFLLNLNASRNHLATACPCPLLFWVPEYLFGFIAEAAPDFFSVRSGVYVFTVARNDYRQNLEQLMSLDYSGMLSLSPTEQQSRLTELIGLLERIRALPGDRRDPLDEANVLERLGLVYYQRGQYAQAEPLLQESLEIRQKKFTGNPS